VGSGALRLFVAVDVPAEVREAVDVACAPLRRAAPEARWVPSERWHLTLVFLGGVPWDRVDAVGAAVAAGCADLPAPVLALDGRAGTFRRQVLWAGLEASPVLDVVSARVRGALLGARIAFDDKPFRPHLTLARAPGRGRLPADLAESYAGPIAAWTVPEVALVRSETGRGGARYTRVAAFPLGVA
jgi:RNA 2',3'-cyclic 3'-phosphodiesterase